MKKEIIFALLAGSLLGFAATSFIWYKNQQKETTSSPAQSENTSGPQLSQASPTPGTPASPDLKLEISSPQSNELFNKDQITVEGNTNPGNTIVIVTDTDSYFTLPDDKGKFKTEVELQGGLNQINISATSPTGKIQTETILVTFSTAKI